MVPYAERWSPPNSRITSHPVSGCRDLEVRPLGGDRGGHEGSAVMGATSELMRGPRRVRCPPHHPYVGEQRPPPPHGGHGAPLLHPGAWHPSPSRGVYGSPPHMRGARQDAPGCGPGNAGCSICLHVRLGSDLQNLIKSCGLQTTVHGSCYSIRDTRETCGHTWPGS